MFQSGKARYLALAFLLIFLCFVFWDFLFWSGRFPPNCYIEKLDVSGLSKIEALSRLKSVNVDEIVTVPVSLYLDNKTLIFKPSDLGIYISPRRTITNSSNVSYRSNYLVDLIKRVLGTYRQEVIPLALEVDRQTVAVVLEGLANNTDTPSKDATFDLTDEKTFKIVKERIGRRLDVFASIRNLEDALKMNGRGAAIEVSILYPRVYARELVKYPPKNFLSEYITYYGSHDSPNRVHNIKVATVRLNNYVICSGETFSLLEKLGEFSRARGFKEAFVLANDELEPQYGGGSCQIATTLYNAALLAGLEIKERFNHGIYFTIYPLGRDASIYSGSRDLQIKNNTFHPIYIKGTASDKKLTFRIYGTPTGKKVSFSRPMIFFEAEDYRPYNVMSDEAKDKINRALINGESFWSYVKVIIEEAGYRKEKTIVSHYKMTGDKENVKIVRPEPD